jgi:hypothetical protein
MKGNSNMNENLASTIKMLTLKAKRMSKDSIIESLNNLEIAADAKVDFEASKTGISVTVEIEATNGIETITYSLKCAKGRKT